jgi:hypothetical protein
MAISKCCANCEFCKEKPILYNKTYICTRNGKEKYLDNLKVFEKKCLFYKEKSLTKI